jgi:hypothetical protein
VATAGWLAGQPARADIFYVDDDAPLGGDGMSWDTAFKYVQDALAVVGVGNEIHIAGGAYRPDQSETGVVTPGDRHASFHLVSGLAIYGGYAGLANPTDPDARDIALYDTILNGDLAGNDDPNDVFLNRTDNSYHVVIASNTDASARLDGVTIQGGFAVTNDGEPNGGGIYMLDGSATVADCTIRRNATHLGVDTPNAPAAGSGGGVYCQGGAPTFTDCTVSGNATGPGQNGHGLYYLNSSAGGSGAGLCFCAAQPLLSGCSIISNRTGKGGNGHAVEGMGHYDAAPGGGGGGVYVAEGSVATFADCTFSDNNAGLGGTGHYGTGMTGTGWGGPGGGGGSGGALLASSSDAVVSGCILSGNHSGAGGTGGGAGSNGHGNVGGAGGTGGAVSFDGGVVSFVGCDLLSNHGGTGGGGGSAGASGGGGSHGGDGGAFRLIGATASVRNCRFTSNVSGNGGGGGAAYQSWGTAGNGGSAGDGGAVVATNTQTVFTVANCLIADNHTGNGGNGGGGLGQPGAGGTSGQDGGLRSEAQLTLRNCTIASNVVGDPGTPNGTAALTGGVELLPGGTADLCSLILWGNTGAAATVEGQQIAGTPPTIDHCCVQGWTGDLGGVGNIGGDPLFVDASGGNYHLGAGSAAIDSGNNACVDPDDLDLDSNERRADDPGAPDCPQGGCGDPPIVDMGCYELGAPPGDCNGNGIPDDIDPAICRGDANCDGQVDFGDINPFVAALSNGLYCDGTGCNVDINGDCGVDFGDINPFVALLTSAPLPISCD